jgi:hypothetical protein
MINTVKTDILNNINLIRDLIKIIFGNNIFERSKLMT